MSFINSREAKITELLEQARGGDHVARHELADAVYAELHRIAKGYLRKERSDHTLQPTALVNEAYLKIFGGAEVPFANRAHFFAVGSQAMRRILVDHARAHGADRRGGKSPKAPLDADLDVADGALQQDSLVELDLALEALAREKETLAQLIEMRYFGGMTAEESAEALGRTPDAVRHDIRFAHAWLRRYMARSGASQ